MCWQQREEGISPQQPRKLCPHPPWGPPVPSLPFKITFDFSWAAFICCIHRQKEPRNVACWGSWAKGEAAMQPRKPQDLQRGRAMTTPRREPALDLQTGATGPTVCPASEAACCVTMANLLTSLWLTILTVIFIPLLTVQRLREYWDMVIVTHNIVNILETTEVYTFKWLKW